MSGGSQHNPNGRQSQLGPGWSPLQVANFLARAPQAHMASDRGVTWHTPTPPPHMYHVPAPSPPDPLQGLLQLQAMKNAAGNSVFRHTATPPELYRHTPTPPDKHLLRHTPSPGDVKAGAALPPGDLYPHLGPGREKLRPEELLSYARVGVDLSLAGRASAGANGSASSPSPAPAPAPASTTVPPGAPAAPPAHPPSPALSVRDAPTINSLIARAQPHARHAHARVDALLERLVPSPVSPHSVIVHSRAAPTPSPPSSNEDSTDSCGAPPGSKRKRKPERTLRVPTAPLITPAVTVPTAPASVPASAPSPSIIAPAPAPAASPPPVARLVPPEPPTKPLENGDAPHAQHNGPERSPTPPPASQPQPHPPQEEHSENQQPDRPPSRRKTRSGSAETIDDIAAMIASTTRSEAPAPPALPPEAPVTPVMEMDVPGTIDKLKSVLASPEPAKPETEPEVRKSPAKSEEKPSETPLVEAAAAPRRRSARTSNSESTNVPVESPSEAKPAEPETSGARSAEPTAASFVEVENQLEKMFAGLEEGPASNENNGTESAPDSSRKPQTTKARKRRKSAPTKGDRKASRRSSRASTGENGPRRKLPRKKVDSGKGKKNKEAPVKDAYDSGSNASSSRSRGPYIQIRGPRDSPLSVSVINAWTGEEEGEAGAGGGRRKADEFRNGLRGRGLHASTLGLRYDAATADRTWLCAFCERGPHAAAPHLSPHHPLGDLFGPYPLDTDCDEYRELEEATRRKYAGCTEVWFHEACGVWAPGLVAAGARLWGLAAAVWAARGARCALCGRAGAALACAARACRARAHVPCAATPAASWRLDHARFRALCPRHAAASV
ncbi:ras-associated and pleckstrin homology domains-containing protein 1-like isoform X2 [Galleria mellonella]|uniref:Ras-associated and pleckstrin homology domains-containing protein 1-like isoform X2 n=1 Tax=Galleria mellonella TaxID=7137 RepID=A0ABM3N742_GALME|nr:ras-associated and pleckstrin homology domains-containing protein 1-like isoform X2 [Galleria mellonella]